ncbi:arginine--tRNA ligase [Ornithinibacillus sp. 4-3]|uniref:Arginine--tRNA ligase n=1 Tax=Ornithinibacillus sp. 4-3 TaxID=3231488 RepID=A0AB39HQ69_9BACI
MSILSQTEDQLKQEIAVAAQKANLATEAELPNIVLEKPKDKAHGDFATNIAMQLARIAKKAPRQIAEELIGQFDKQAASVEKVDIAGPGFINFFMKKDFLGEVIPAVLQAGEAYGHTNVGEGKKVQIEFVSVNPTGALHLGHARGAAFGDTLCNVLAAAGYEVDREYYINDAGNQIDNLALSIEARYLEALGQEVTMPADGYVGPDIINIAKDIIEADGDKWLKETQDARIAYFKEYGLNSLLKKIETDLSAFRVNFDHWFSERTLYQDGQITDALETLKERNYVYEQDGATWLRSTDFGDDKDRVLVKKDGSYTYLTPDIAYHRNKYERGYDKVINVWGADHHGYITRMEAAIEALGYDKDKFLVKIIQMVNLLESGETLRMSKRKGNAVSLRELMDEVGVDAVRYYFVTRSNDSQLDFDTELARSQSNDNPVFYVQYAHARICTMLKQAEKQGFDLNADYDVTLLVEEKELDLLKKLGEFPQVVTNAAQKYMPHIVTQYVYDLAALLHSFYNAVKVLDANQKDLTQARIALITAVRQTLANALEIIGVSAPEQM